MRGRLWWNREACRIFQRIWETRGEWVELVSPIHRRVERGLCAWFIRPVGGGFVLGAWIWDIFESGWNIQSSGCQIRWVYVWCDPLAGNIDPGIDADREQKIAQICQPALPLHRVLALPPQWMYILLEIESQLDRQLYWIECMKKIYASDKGA